jgi:hypothetical protein
MKNAQDLRLSVKRADILALWTVLAHFCVRFDPFPTSL